MYEKSMNFTFRRWIMRVEDTVWQSQHSNQTANRRYIVIMRNKDLSQINVKFGQIGNNIALPLQRLNLQFVSGRINATEEQNLMGTLSDQKSCLIQIIISSDTAPFLTPPEDYQASQTGAKQPNCRRNGHGHIGNCSSRQCQPG